MKAVRLMRVLHKKNASQFNNLTTVSHSATTDKALSCKKSQPSRTLMYLRRWT
eukprot:UN12465